MRFYSVFGKAFIVLGFDAVLLGDMLATSGSTLSTYLMKFGIKIFFSEYRQGGCNMFFCVYNHSTRRHVQEDSNCHKFK